LRPLRVDSSPFSGLQAPEPVSQSLALALLNSTDDVLA
jgi:hypothetical protein